MRICHQIISVNRKEGKRNQGKRWWEGNCNLVLTRVGRTSLTGTSLSLLPKPPSTTCHRGTWWVPHGCHMSMWVPHGCMVGATWVRGCHRGTWWVLHGYMVVGATRVHSGCHMGAYWVPHGCMVGATWVRMRHLPPTCHTADVLLPQIYSFCILQLHPLALQWKVIQCTTIYCPSNVCSTLCSTCSFYFMK